MARFPDIQASDLDGRSYALPGELPPGPRLLVLATRRWQQVLVEMWKARASRLAREHPCLGVWEIALLPRRYVPARPLIDGGMRASLTDPAARRRTLTAYTDIEEVASALGIEDLETVHVFLVAPDGEVVWRASGRPESSQVDALGEILAWWDGQPCP